MDIPSFLTLPPNLNITCIALSTTRYPSIYWSRDLGIAGGIDSWVLRGAISGETGPQSTGYKLIHWQ